MVNFMSNAELDGQQNAKKPLSEIAKKKKEELAIKTLSRVAPLIKFELSEPDKPAYKRGDKFLIRGSFVHSSGQELAAVSELRYDFDDEMITTISGDIAEGYENDRRRKEEMTLRDLKKREIKS